VAIIIASTHFAYSQKDGQAELAWVAWLTTKMVYLQTVTHLSTNPARRRVTLLMRPLHQTTTWINGGHEIHTTGDCDDTVVVADGADSNDTAQTEK